MTMLAGLLKGPAAYVPRSGWPPWAALPAALVIFGLAALTGWLVAQGYGAIAGVAMPETASPAAFQSQVTVTLVAWLAGLQIGLIVYTLAAAGLFSSSRAGTLALERPAGGWRVLPVALIPLIAGSALWTGLLLYVNPAIVFHDLKPFQSLLHSNAVWAVLLVISVGAPLSEELLFRGFLFSALAKSRLGLIGTGLLTALLWTALHAGYSIFGLAEVLAIGLYFSWLLVRTGSLWVTIFCHAAYNTLIATALLFVTLPS